MYHDRTGFSFLFTYSNKPFNFFFCKGLRGTKGNIIRIRWYGSHANPPPDCFVERKTRQVLTETEYYQIDEAVKVRKNDYNFILVTKLIKQLCRNDLE